MDEGRGAFVHGRGTLCGYPGAGDGARGFRPFVPPPIAYPGYLMRCVAGGISER